MNRDPTKSHPRYNRTTRSIPSSTPESELSRLDVHSSLMFRNLNFPLFTCETDSQPGTLLTYRLYVCLRFFCVLSPPPKPPLLQR